VLGAGLLAWLNWRAIFWVVAGFSAFCFAGVLWGVPETLAKTARAGGSIRTVAGRYAGLLRKADYIGYALVTGFGYALLFAYISSSPFLFIQLYGVTPQQFSLLFMTNAAGLYAAGQFNRVLLRRLGPRQVLARAVVLNLAAATLLLILLTAGLARFPVFAALLFVLVASLGWIFPNIIAVAMKPVGDQAGAASALLGVLQFTFGAASASLVGALANGTAFPAVGVIAGASLCSLLILLGFERLIRR
jgi:DHA1 family bicyclomycin/chloramphenicol resistance-like MFS transporter